MEKDIEKFKTFLKKNHSLWSTEREQITRYVFSHNEHLSADDLYLQLKGDGYTISRATVYRTLDLLVRSRLVVKTQLKSGTYLYEYIKDSTHHDHLICNICGKIIEFHSDEIEDLQQQVCEENDFLMTGHTLRISGICKECREKEK